MSDYVTESGIDQVLKDLTAQLNLHKPPKDTVLLWIADFFRNKHQVATSHVSTPPSLSSHSSSSSSGGSRDLLEVPSIPAHDNMIDEEEEPEPEHRPPAPRGKRRMAICSEPAEIDVDNASAIPVIEKTKQTQERLDRALKTNVLFSHLEQDERREVFNAMEEKKFKAGANIIKQGEEGDYFYVIENGECEVWVARDGGPSEKVMEIGESGSFGELALIYGSPRAATVKAITDVTLWAIDRVTYRRILMGATMKKRKLYESFLERVPILAPLHKYERLTVADALEPVYFNDGETVVRQGDLGDGFYIIVDGEVRVLQDLGDGEKEVARLYSSSYFGEIALLTNRPRAATVVAVGQCKCVKMDREKFVRVMGPCEDILVRNMNLYNQYVSVKI
eukprot:TRINITY_DN386_c0_g1_i3.p1 TRINITY_DN386_c0_g1~~TRINITY_DN386_c0_g1_i3.p1  ORF type:complete len:392 (+),score=71.86 TRINITY_DN386_c0_g1_i3:235-1410(+)